MASKKEAPAAEWVRVDDLCKWEKNPRINASAIQEVRKSIERFGFGAPIVAQKSSKRVIAGHTRLEAARLAGLETVPVRYLDLDDEDAESLSLADNKLGEIAQWDISRLTGFLDEGLDLGDLGWSNLELGELTAASSPVISDATARRTIQNEPTKRSTIVSLMLLVDDSKLIEDAIDAASGGEDISRGQAMIKICERYLASEKA
jgi:hypothetical protein